MSDHPATTNDPGFKPASAEVEHRAIELAKADGLTWVTPVTPDLVIENGLGSATNDDRNRYRKLARERLEAERGLTTD